LEVIAPRDGEIVGDAPDRRVEILCEHDGLHATWSRFGPGREGADLHVHRRHTDLFYVLTGELTIRLGIEDEPVALPAGTLARVPPMVVHGFRNASRAEVTYLNFHSPGRGFASFMRSLRDGDPITYDQEPPPPGGTRPATEAVFTRAADRPGTAVEQLAEVAEIAVAECRGEPGEHRDAPQEDVRCARSYYVLEGELEIGAQGHTRRATAGSWVQVPPGLGHAVASPGPEPVRYLDVSTPASPSAAR